MRKIKSALAALAYAGALAGSVAALWFSAWLALLAQAGAFAELPTREALGIESSLFFTLLFAALALAWAAIGTGLVAALYQRAARLNLARLSHS